MSNRILNVTADGSWQTLGPVDFPNRVYALTLQARTAVDVLFRFSNQTNYMTVKSGSTLLVQLKMRPGDVQVQATNGTIIEMMLFTETPGALSG